MHSFLFELGTEELPDNLIVPAALSLEESLKKILNESSLSYGTLFSACTPRRLALVVHDLPARQEDIDVVKIGPALSIAYDKDNELSPAGRGFLKKCGAEAEHTFVEHNAKGDFLAVRFTQKGKSTLEILQAWIPEAIARIPQPKSMIWKEPNFSFSRPIRWIVALWDEAVIDLDFHGIKASRYSYANRYLGMDYKVQIPDASSYEESLMAAKVVVNREKRKKMISEQMDHLLADSGHSVVQDERLLDTVCNLVEYPTAVVAEFEKSFLSLPEKIISSTISQNQKYFSVYDASSKLSNKFIFISNGDPAHSDLIRSGNEKVVHARLEDAMWFFSEDCKHPLEAYVKHLDEVVFQSQLGTLAAKTKRLQKICGYICNVLSLSPDAAARAQRTALLCKADLLTLMLGEKEFTKLQGYMGKQYALASNEDSEVAEGIYEHYMPRGSNDSLPQSLSGAICAVADKLDTVAGIIGVGMLPTGSADPFALRRAAGGLVQILAARKWNMNLNSLIDFALETLREEVELQEETESRVKNFFEQRVIWLLKENGISYDVVSAVMNTGYMSLDDLIAKARALDALKSQENFIRLVIGFKRVSNIIAQSKSFARLEPARLEPGAETELFDALACLRLRIDEALSDLDYPQALQHLVRFGILIDNYFDAVLVNCEDAAIRDNRYALLAQVRAEFLRVADLSLIVVENELNGE